LPTGRLAGFFIPRGRDRGDFGYWQGAANVVQP